MNGPAISFRTEGSRFTAVYALPGDGHWRTVSVDGKAITLDSAREAEAIAGHVLCAKLHQQPAVIQEPMRKSLHDLLNDLMDWQAGMGGFEAQVWAHVEKMRERLAEPEAGQVLLAVVGAR